MKRDNFLNLAWLGLLLLLTAWPTPAVGAFTVQPKLRADTTVLSLYAPGNLTLVEDLKTVLLEKGRNRLRYRWNDRRVDTRSMEMSFVDRADQGMQISNRSFSRGDTHAVTWLVDSDRRQSAAIVVSYFIGGLKTSIRYNFFEHAFGDTGRILGRFRIQNTADQRIKPTKTRVVFDRVEMLSSIRETVENLSRAGEPSGGTNRKGSRNVITTRTVQKAKNRLMSTRPSRSLSSDTRMIRLDRRLSLGPNSTIFVRFVSREGFGYHHHYRAIVQPDRTPLKKILHIPNTELNGLGEAVLPEGQMFLFQLEKRGAPRWAGRSGVRKTLPGDTVTIQRDGPENIRVTRRLLDRQKQNFQFDRRDNVTGWSETRVETITVRNHRSDSITIDLRRNFSRANWTLVNTSHPYTGVSKNQVQFRPVVPPQSKKSIRLTYRLPFGSLK